MARTGDGVVVKRAGKDESGDWRWLSDHPSWEPVPCLLDVEVIGEVMWVARTL